MVTITGNILASNEWTLLQTFFINFLLISLRIFYFQLLKDILFDCKHLCHTAKLNIRQIKLYKFCLVQSFMVKWKISYFHRCSFQNVKKYPKPYLYCGITFPEFGLRLFTTHLIWIMSPRHSYQWFIYINDLKTLVDEIIFIISLLHCCHIWNVKTNICQNSGKTK